MVKFKSWVKDVHRVRGEFITRHGHLRLDKNERVTPFPDSFLARLKETLDWEAITAYPETEQLYSALATHLGVARDQIVLTAGSDGAIRHSFDLFVTRGDEVIVLEPTFAMVDVYCGLFGANRRAIGYDQKLNLNVRGLIDAINTRTTLVVIANPNSPTGTILTESALIEILEKAEAHGVPVLVDEAYHGFSRFTALPLLIRHPNLIISRTFSKAHGLAGLRVGYVVASPEIAQMLYRFRPMYEVNAIGVLCALEVLAHPEVTEEYLSATEEGRSYLLGEMNRRGIATRDTATNFVHVDFGEKKAAIGDAFGKHGILVRGGLPISGFEGYLRISLGPAAAMAAVVAAIDHTYSGKGAS